MAPMARYRFYLFENNGKLMGAGDFQSASDDAATECIKQLLRGHNGELWRLVTASDTDDPSVEPKLQ